MSTVTTSHRSGTKSSSPTLIGLAEAEEVVRLPAPLYFQRRANVWRKAVSSAAREAGLVPLRCAGADLYPLDCLHSDMIIRNGRLLADRALLRGLQEEGGNFLLSVPNQASGWALMEVWDVLRQFGPTVKLQRPPPLKRWWSQLRRAMYKSKAWLHGRPAGARKAEADSRRADILCIARLPAQLADMLPVVDWLREHHGLQYLIGACDAATSDRVRSLGLDAVELSSSGRPRRRTTDADTHRRVSRLAAFIKSAPVPAVFEPDEHALLCRGTLSILPAYETHVVAVAEESLRLIQSIKPRLAPIGNPYTLEGRAVARIAQAAGIFTAALEHGSIFSDDPTWEDCPVDLVGVWGDMSRRALLGCGFPGDRIAITGTPRHDLLFRNLNRQPSTNAKINQVLVATSGPGDLVSFAQFEGFIRMLYTAADLAPDVQWLVKLHPKDPPENYRAVCPLGHPRVEIVGDVRTTNGQNIFSFLQTSQALVTLTSTSAIEAMALDVPVISVDLWPEGHGLDHVEYLSPLYTLRVRTAEELAAAAQQAVRREFPAKVQENARAFAGSVFQHRGEAAATAGKKLWEAINHG